MSHFASTSIHIDRAEQRVSVNVNADRGTVAEAIAAQWLMNQRWTILHHRWRCRWGEIDLIAQPTHSNQVLAAPQIMTFNQRSSHLAHPLIFVEVKSRSRGNWDADGLLSITTAKQAKLWKAAELFLSETPYWTQCACRFDVILIRQGRSPQSSASRSALISASSNEMSKLDGMIPIPTSIEIGRWISVNQSPFRLEQHLIHAFEQESQDS